MSDIKRKIILKKLNILGTIWHPETSLIFKSIKERLVIGTYIEGVVIPLNKNTILICNEWNFKPDPSLVINDQDKIEEGVENIKNKVEKEENEKEEEKEEEEENEENEEEEEKEDEEKEDEEEEEEDEEEEEEKEKEDEEEEEEKEDEEEEKDKVVNDKVVNDKVVDDKINKSQRVIVHEEHKNTHIPDINIVTLNIGKILTDNLTIEFNNIVNYHEQNLALKIKEIEELQSRYNVLYSQYTAMKVKFDTMKSLLS
jgi:flagellar biosynthesis GTPase FlhF